MLSGTPVRSLLHLPVLLGLSLLLHLPTLGGQAPGPLVAQLQAAGLRWAQGHELYTEIYDSWPPLAPNLFGLAGGLGPGGFAVLAWLHALLLGVVVFWVNLLLLRYRWHQQELWPAVLLLLALASPWYDQGPTPERLSLLPVVLALALVCAHVADEGQQPSRMFWAGTWMGVAIALRWPSAWLAGGLLLGWIVAGRFRLRELSSFVGALLLVLSFPVVVLVLEERWGAFVQVSLGQSFSSLWLPTPEYGPALSSPLALLLPHGLLGLAALIGFLRVRARFGRLSIVQRKTENVLLSVLLAAILALASSGGQQAHQLAVLLPCVVFYAVQAGHGGSGGGWGSRLVLALVALPLLAALALGFVGLPAATVARLPNVLQAWAQAQLDLPQPLPEAAEAAVKTLPAHQGVWVCGPQAHWYARLQRPVATPFTHHALAQRLWAQMDAPVAQRNPRALLQLYSWFAAERPALVLDTNGQFARLRRQWPGLFGAYVASGPPLPLSGGQRLQLWRAPAQHQQP